MRPGLKKPNKITTTAMNTRHPIKTILPLAAVAAAFTLAPTAEADTVVQTSSADLNLTGRDVLAAVNFYDPDRTGNGQRTVDSTIQGVTFDNFRVNADDTGSPIALSAGVAGATLSTVINQSPGREWGSDPTALDFSGPDATEAENLANGGMYFQDSETATLTFAFGAGWADTAVEVQMPGGGVWGRTERIGKLVMSVGDSGSLGELVDRGIDPVEGPQTELLTFNAVTDGSGGLAIDVVNQNVDGSFGSRQWTFLMGTIVTAGPSSFQPFAITEIDYAPDTGMLTLTWNSSPNETYGVYLSTDMIDWSFEIDDDVDADAGDTTTKSYDLTTDGLAGAGRVYFRVERL